MNEVKKATANLSWSLDIECPHCDKSFDMAKGEFDDDYIIAKYIFTNDWDALRGHEVTCPHCAAEFEIEMVEY